jgi:hypothetical protein
MQPNICSLMKCVNTIGPADMEHWSRKVCSHPSHRSWLQPVFKRSHGITIIISTQLARVSEVMNTRGRKIASMNFNNTRQLKVERPRSRSILRGWNEQQQNCPWCRTNMEVNSACIFCLSSGPLTQARSACTSKKVATVLAYSLRCHLFVQPSSLCRDSCGRLHKAR